MKRTITIVLANMLLALFLCDKAEVSTAPAAFRFISWSDAQTQGIRLPFTSKQAAALNPAFTIFNGDFENDGFTQTEMGLMVNAINGDVTGSSSNGMFNKTFFVRGNHDDHQLDSLALWQGYLNLSATASYVGAANYSEYQADATYSFDYQNARFIGVDVPGSIGDLTDAQIAWIDGRLGDAEAVGLTHAFLFFHGPPYCVGLHCPCTTTSCVDSDHATRLVNVLNKHPVVSATFHGHEHYFAYTHITADRVPGTTGTFHEYEQFITSPSEATSYDNSLNADGSIGPKPYRYDYASGADPAGYYARGFAAVDVNGDSFTVSFYGLGEPAPFKVLSFTKGSVPVPTPAPPGMSTVWTRVSTSTDDAEERLSSGAVDLISSDLELGTNGTAAQVVGLRFNSVNVPEGAIITNAYLEFQVDEIGSTATSLRIYGQAADNPPTFTTAPRDVAGRNSTAAHVAWPDVGPWDILETKRRSPDLSPIIQEIVGRASWTAGNSMVLMLDGSGSRTAFAYDRKAIMAPLLVVTYVDPRLIPTPSETPRPTLTATATLTPTLAQTSTSTASATPSLTAAPTHTPTASSTAMPTDTFTPTATSTSSLTPTPAAEATQTPSSTATFTATPTFTPSSTATLTATPTFTPSSTAIFTATPTFTPTATSIAGSTGYLSPARDAAQKGGDGNGYEASPGNAYASDGLFAVDINSGTSTSSSCTNAGKDKHLFYEYAVSIPNGASVKGLEVQLQAKADSTSGSPKICVQLSWNGGAKWTSAKSTTTLTTAKATYLLGGAADTWGHVWTASELGNANFRVRLINVATSTARDFSLDWVAVRVIYR